MKIEKKHIVAAVIAGVSITGAIAYLQYKKLMNYCIGFNKIRANKISQTNADIDVFINFKNQSDLKIEIESQEYNVYLNDAFLTKASNAKPQVIAPKSMSVIGINVRFNPSQAGKNILNVLLSGSGLSVRIDMKLKVKFWFFTVNIPYTYKTTLKELMAPSPTGSASVICK